MDHERQLDAQPKGLYWSLRRFWKAYLQEADILEKKKPHRQVLKQAWLWGWQPLKAVVESGGLSIRPDYYHS